MDLKASRASLYSIRRWTGSQWRLARILVWYDHADETRLQHVRWSFELSVICGRLSRMSRIKLHCSNRVCQRPLHMQWTWRCLPKSIFECVSVLWGENELPCKGCPRVDWRTACRRWLLLNSWRCAKSMFVIKCSNVGHLGALQQNNNDHTHYHLLAWVRMQTKRTIFCSVQQYMSFKTPIHLDFITGRSNRDSANIKRILKSLWFTYRCAPNKFSFKLSAHYCSVGQQTEP